jgi:tripartite ATP-independent transporter DctM subunit
MLIVYAATAGISVVKLYAGAIFPGFLLAGLYMIYVVGRAWLNPKLAPKPPEEETKDITRMQIVWMMLTSFFPLAVLILSVLGAILFGLATPSEAAAVGALGGLVLAAAYRALTWQRLKEAVYLTVRTSAMVCWLFVGSWTFSSVFSYLGGHSLIESFVLGLELTPIMFLILAQLIIFVLGWPLEWSEIIIIFVPIFLPMLPHFGIDPLFFGILVALNLQTSFLTPPMAMAAYYLKGVAPPHIQLVDIFKGCLPFLAMVFIAMTLLYTFPDIAHGLPRYLYGR